MYGVFVSINGIFLRVYTDGNTPMAQNYLSDFWVHKVWGPHTEPSIDVWGKFSRTWPPRQALWFTNLDVWCLKGMCSWDVASKATEASGCPHFFHCEETMTPKEVSGTLGTIWNPYILHSGQLHLHWPCSQALENPQEARPVMRWTGTVTGGSALELGFQMIYLKTRFIMIYR